jgi:MFS family permease
MSHAPTRLPNADEVLPIYASAPPHEGGLGFSTSQLAPSLSFGGTVLMLWSLFGFPVLLKRFGTKRVVQIGLWQTPLFAALLPLASLCAGRMLPAQLIMFAGMGLRGMASTNAFTACIIMVNQFAPEGTLGSVNGAGQSLASFVRAAAPALGGLSWGWSTGLGFPGHQFLPFLFIAAVAMGTLLVYRQLEPPQVEVPSADNAEEA